MAGDERGAVTFWAVTTRGTSLYFLPLPHGHGSFLPTLGGEGPKSISASDGMRNVNVVLP